MMRIRSMAEMPVRRVEISNTARNHIFRGLRVFSSTVPAVRLVWWSQSRHSNVVPERIGPTYVEPQRAHAGLPPQRASIQYARQSSSVANRFSNSVAVLGKSRQRSSGVRCVMAQLLAGHHVTHDYGGTKGRGTIHALLPLYLVVVLGTPALTVSGIAALIASVVAGTLWDAIGPIATFATGAVFTILAFAGLVAARNELPRNNPAISRAS